MIENNPSNVSSAFEMLSEEVEAEIDFVNGVGAGAFEKRDYDRAREALERAGVLTAFRDRVAPPPAPASFPRKRESRRGRLGPAARPSTHRAIAHL